MGASGDLARSWQICFNLLPKVSRTFALSIVGLKEPLRGEVCVSYLLCRLLDTVEDAPGLSVEDRRLLMAPLLEGLHGGAPDDREWRAAVERLLPGRSSSADLDLMRNQGHVRACFRAAGEPSRLAIARWVSEMGKGMVAWSERMGGGGGIKTLPTMAALDRYCYYIAGTVGYLLTDLFFIHSPYVDQALYFRLQSDAEEFGLGLQKVNIVKDVADDLRRGWCFIPTELLRREGLEPAQLADPAKADHVYRTLLPVLGAAAGHLERGWRYLSRFPVEEREIRLFLAYSLFFAVRTLALAAEDSGRLVAAEKLKISRTEVAALVASCQLKIEDPEALEKAYRKASAPLAKFQA